MWVHVSTSVLGEGAALSKQDAKHTHHQSVNTPTLLRGTFSNQASLDLEG